MAHINYPTDFLGQTILLGNIIEQVGKDGPNGPLVAMLAFKKIDLTKDNIACNAAILDNVLFLAAKKSSQKFCQQRNTLIKPIMKHIRDSFQFLKSFFKPNFKPLGNWGATITTNGKITYPSGIQAKVNLLLAMKKKNDSYTTKPSPLQPYLTQNTISLGTDALNCSTSLMRQVSMTEANTQAEDYREERDNGWKIPLANIHLIGDFWVNLFSNNTKAIGDYEYAMVEEVQAAKGREIKLKSGEIKLQVKVKIGSTISNAGTGDLYIYKGKLIAGNPIVLKAGTSQIVAKGYSIFSVINPSTTKGGILTLIPK